MLIFRAWATCGFNLHRRRDLTPVNKVCEAATIPLFWAPKGLNELQKMRFEFPFDLTNKSTMGFLTCQSWRVLKFWYTSGTQNKDFCTVS